ncbi:hypothetical protein IWZ00DRAFT_485622 [Phyllosticta capitalensis]
MAQDVENAALSSSLPNRSRSLSLEARLTDQSGYTGFANVISSPDYMNFRRFKVLRVRMILRKQFEIERLEKELHQLDNSDRQHNVLWLNSQELDGNKRREEVFAELDTVMAAYGQSIRELSVETEQADSKADDLLKRSQYVMTAPAPSNQRVKYVQEAIKSYIVEDERGYLYNDLLNIAGAQDPRLGKLLLVSEYLVHLILTLRDQIRKMLGLFKATDRVYVSPALFRKVARTITAVLSAVILLLPIVVLNVVETSTMRLVVVFLSAISFISALTILTAAGTMEVFVAGATYSAVLVVFVSQNGMAGSGI